MEAAIEYLGENQEALVFGQILILIEPIKSFV